MCEGYPLDYERGCTLALAGTMGVPVTGPLPGWSAGGRAQPSSLRIAPVGQPQSLGKDVSLTLILYINMVAGPTSYDLLPYFRFIDNKKQKNY